MDRGIARYELKNPSGAEQDLEQSLRLLPSAPAHLYLGYIDERRNNLRGAVAHYKEAAASKSSYGQKAQASLMRLDLPNNPGNYLKVSGAVSSNGELILQLANPTNVTVRNVMVTISDGQRTWKQAFRNNLAPQKQARSGTGIGPISTEQARRLQVRVVSAEVVQ